MGNVRKVREADGPGLFTST